MNGRNIGPCPGVPSWGRVGGREETGTESLGLSLHGKGRQTTLERRQNLDGKEQESQSQRERAGRRAPSSPTPCHRPLAGPQPADGSRKVTGCAASDEPRRSERRRDTMEAALVEEYPATGRDGSRGQGELVSERQGGGSPENSSAPGL